MSLSKVQAEEIRQTAREVVYGDCHQNWDYLKAIVDAYVDGQASAVERAELVSNDRDMWPDLFSFDPATGKSWPDDGE